MFLPLRQKSSFFLKFGKIIVFSIHLLLNNHSKIKYMKRKTYVIIFGIIVFLIIALIALPFVFKSKIVETLKLEVNKSLNATVDFNENIGLNLFTNFPNLHLKIRDVSVANKAPFLGDTLAQVGVLSANLNIVEALKGKIEVKEIKISRSKIYLHVLNDSVYSANWDIMLPSDEPEDTSEDSTVFKLPVKLFVIDKSDFVYNDESLDMLIDVRGIHVTGKGDLSLDVFDLIAKGTMESTSFSYDGIPYVTKAKTKVESKVNIDMVNYKYTFNKTTLWLNDFNINVDGYLAIPADDIIFDASFNSPQTDFKSLLSMIPALYAKDFEKLTAKGSMLFSGKVKGIYNDNTIPGFNIKLEVKNGMFQYPDLPSSISNVNLLLNVINPDGIIDHTVVNLEKFHAMLGKEVVDAKVLVKTPVTDPYMDAYMKGNINLANVRNFIKLDENMKLSGMFKLDLAAKGFLSYIENEQYQKFIANGKLDISNLKYYYEEMKKEVKIPLMQMTFSPQQVELTQMKVKIDNNDLTASGTLFNFIPYLFDKGVLTGKLNLHSVFMNINDFLVNSSPAGNEKKQDAENENNATEMTVFELPGNIDFQMNAVFNRLIYDKMDLKNATCSLLMKNKRLSINNLQADLLNGKIAVNGYYETIIKNKPVFDFNMKLQNLEVKAAYNTFKVVQKFVPIAAFSRGIINAELAVNSWLKQNMMPDFATFFSKGFLSVKELGIVDFIPLSMAADALEMKYLKNPTLKSIKPSYLIKNGKLTLNPMNFKIDKTNFTVSGYNGLDKSMNYEIKADVPVSELKNKSANLISSLGISSIADLVGETVPVFIYITGSYDKPQIKTSVKKITKSVTEVAKEKAEQELNKQKQNAENVARQEAERQKQILENKAKQEQERLRLEAEKKKKDLEEKARLEAEKKKKLLEEEAKKKLKGILK